jgi:ATP synthase protein I
MVRAPSRAGEGPHDSGFTAFGGAIKHMPEPQDLERLGARLDEARRREAAKAPRIRAPTPLGVAFRFGTELLAATVVGGAMGWGLDWLFGTRPVLTVVLFMLGAAAGIRNVMRVSKELNAQVAAVNDDKEQ